ncbi:flagellar basal-body MS-ring/collar protein FliF [Ramlibacter sp. MAHUQ-53]|uniref:flagellar basal-body MS-ring/collar protein FliF n=1 Tax=unclassified Ramlibacter TaxID=2617605 RepID=UPI00362695D9
MDTTLASPALPDKTSARALPPALDRVMALPRRALIALGLGAAAVAAVIAVAASLGQRTEWRVLYANLSDRDGGGVVAALTQMNVPHQFTEGGGAIMVPAAQVHEVRLRLASQGLPKGGAVGFELVENQKFGTTQFQERLNFQRGLEGELARSIMALAAVQSARVHLALPQQTAFLREQHKPSASVLLTLHGGRSLDRGQVAGIVHLVASSVPDLHPKAVSVLDQSGALLSQEGADAPNGLDAAQLRYVQQTEQGLAARILAIVEPIVGPGNVKAQVTADVDFTQSESTAELYGANQGGNAAQAVRSQHLSETPGAAGQAAGGIPGALSNQPPASPASPVNGAPQALSAGPQAGAAAGGGSKRDAVTNYEVDKTIKVTRNATGVVRRLNAAVVVNHTTDAKGAAAALPPEQMEQVNALVREAIGFSKERGDSVNVVNAAFRAAPVAAVPALPLWKQPEVLEMARTLAPWVALPIVALVIIFGMVRPALRASRAAPVDGGKRLLDATVHDAVALPTPGAAGGATVSVNLPETGNGLPGAESVPLLPTAQAAAQHARTSQVENIRQLARQNPATVANVVRNWVTTPSS